MAAIRPEDLGAPSFRRDHSVRYAYVAGAMYKAIASKELVARMANAHLLAYLGTGGRTIDEIASDLHFIQANIPPGASFGANLLSNPTDAALEEATVDLYLRANVTRVEAAAYIDLTPALIRYRLAGAQRSDGAIHVPNHVLAKVSRPEVAIQFLSPPAPAIVSQLLAAGKIHDDEAEIAPHIPVAGDVCVEADSGGHTDQGVAYAITPPIIRLRTELCRKYRFAAPSRVGSAGGLGTPDAIAAAFVLGAEFVLTGSINQCTVEAGTSDRVKDLLQTAGAKDMAVVPAGDMFEIGARMQVFKKGLLFPARSARLYELYRQFDSWDAIDEKTRRHIETRYFQRGFAEIAADLRAYYTAHNPAQWAAAERSPKQLMALVFRWYFYQTNLWAMSGDPLRETDYQIQCGPALGSFNQWAKGTAMEHWRNRHPDQMAEALMQAAAAVLNSRFDAFQGN